MKMKMKFPIIAASIFMSFQLNTALSQTITNHLDTILATKKVRICIWPDYYGITYRNPKTQNLNGIDIDLANELSRDLGVTAEFIDSSFSTLIFDINSNKCDVAMFAVGITAQRFEKIRFSTPTLVSDIYAITTQSNRHIRKWSDIDQSGIVVAVMKGTLHESVMRERLKFATLKIVNNPMAREQEVLSGRADVFMTDYPYSRRMLETTDWARLVSPPSTYHETKYAYAVAFGDDLWAHRIEKFVQDIQNDGRLLKAAKRYKLESIVIKNKND